MTVGSQHLDSPDRRQFFEVTVGLKHGECLVGLHLIGQQPSDLDCRGQWLPAIAFASACERVPIRDQSLFVILQVVGEVVGPCEPECRVVRSQFESGLQIGLGLRPSFRNE